MTIAHPFLIIIALQLLTLRIHAARSKGKAHDRYMLARAFVDKFESSKATLSTDEAEAAEKVIAYAKRAAAFAWLKHVVYFVIDAGLSASVIYLAYQAL